MTDVLPGDIELHPPFEAHLLDQLEVSVFVTDTAGTITYWNRRAEDLFGWPRDEAVGRPVDDLLVAQRDNGNGLGVLDRLRGGEAFEGQFPVRRRDGTRILAGVRISPLLDAAGLPMGAVGVAQDITERWRTERRLQAQYAVTAVLAAAESFAGAAPGIVRAVCEALGWVVGAIWEVPPQGTTLRLADLWSDPSSDVAEFERMTRTTELSPGVGLPGRVWEQGAAQWIPDVTVDTNFPRAAAATQVGLHGAFGFPILVGLQVVGVIEFFSHEIQEPDQDLLDLMTAVGSQIGQFIDRKQAEAALRESEARKGAMLESAMDAVVAMDHHGLITEFNPAAEAMFGHARDDVLGKEVADVLVPPRLRARHRKGLTRYLETGEGPAVGTRIEFPAIRADGSEFPIELAVTRVDLPGPPLFEAYIRDVTDRLTAERDRAMLASIVQTSNDAIFGKDLDGVIRTWNVAAERLYGYTAEEMVGRNVSTLVPPGYPNDVPEIMAQIRRGERVVRHETRRVRKDGVMLDVEITVSPIRAADGTLVGASTIARDVTERKWVERRQQFLVEAGKVLTGSLDYETTLSRIARLAVPELADWCIVYVVEDDGYIRRLDLAHVDPAKEDIARSIRTRFTLNREADEGVPAVLRSGQPVLVPDATPEVLAADVDDPDGLAELNRLIGVRSWMCVPMSARGRTLGAMSFISAESGRRYTDADLALVADLARDAGLAVDNARLYEAERRARRSAELAATRTALLHTVSTTLSGALAPAEVASIVVGRGVSALGARAGLMTVLSEDGRSLEIVHTEGYPSDFGERWQSFPLDAPYPLSEAVRTGAPVFLETLADRTQRYPALGEPSPDEVDHAVACLPMFLDSRPVGGLTFSFGQPRLFDEADRIFMAALARQAAQAVERARLYQAEREARAEAERAGDRVAFLAEASRVLSSSLDYTRTLAKVTRLTVPRLADWCSIDMLEDSGAIKQLAVAHVDPTKVKWARRLRRRLPPKLEDPTGVPAVIRTGKPELYPTITDEMIDAVPDPKVRDIVRSLGLQSLVILPLKAGGRTLGALTLVWADSGRSYGSEDLELAEELARRAAQAIENARLYHERDSIARTLQQSLLPPELPAVPGMELASLYLPAGAGNEVGGDFYDVFEGGDGSWGLVIGDVCGKGPLAASVMGLARYTLRAAAMQERRPSRILGMLSEAVRNQSTDGRFITVCYVRLRTNERGARLTVCCGGHPLPAVLRADGTIEATGAPGTLLGLFEDPVLVDHQVDLGPGDALILYTDGITDVAPSAAVGGEQDLTDLLAGAAGEDAAGIVEHVKRELGRRIRKSRRDDMAVLVARVTS